MAGESLDPDSFIDSYGLEAPVLVGQGMSMSLGQALEMERLLCPADAETRADTVKRLHYLAGMLAAAGTLRDEHAYLMETAE